MALQELSYHLEITLPFLPKWCMTRVLKLDPLRPTNIFDEWMNDEILCDVESSIDDERRRFYGMKPIYDGPIAEETFIHKKKKIIP